jgi:glycosyltransferase involved in cell wall biosynthesis
MTHDIKFSVTVPAYKAQFLAECIDSILAQTYKNFELIIVNDASPQDLDSIVSKYDDSRIRYYKNKVGFGAEHVVGNWNKCLEYATGDYIICMGDDDKLLPNCLEEYVKLIKKYPGLGLYHGWLLQINEKSKIVNITPPLPQKESVYSFVYARICHGRRLQYIGDLVYDINLLRDNGGFFDMPFGWGSDDISAFLAASLSGVAHTQVPVFEYRVNSQSISNSSHNREKMEAMFFQYNWLTNFLSTINVNSSNGISSLFKEQALKELPAFLTSNLKSYINNDFKVNNCFSCMLYWNKMRKKYHFKMNIILKGFIRSLFC